MNDRLRMPESSWLTTEDWHYIERLIDQQNWLRERTIARAWREVVNDISDLGRRAGDGVFKMSTVCANWYLCCPSCEAVDPTFVTRRHPCVAPVSHN